MLLQGSMKICGEMTMRAELESLLHADHTNRLIRSAVYSLYFSIGEDCLGTKAMFAVYFFG